MVREGVCGSWGGERMSLPLCSQPPFLGVSPVPEEGQQICPSAPCTSCGSTTLVSMVYRAQGCLEPPDPRSCSSCVKHSSWGLLCVWCHPFYQNTVPAVFHRALRYQDIVAKPVLAQPPDLVPWPHPEVVGLWVLDWHKGFKNGVLFLVSWALALGRGQTSCQLKLTHSPLPLLGAGRLRLSSLSWFCRVQFSGNDGDFYSTPNFLQHLPGFWYMGSGFSSRFCIPYSSPCAPHSLPASCESVLVVPVWADSQTEAQCCLHALA